MAVLTASLTRLRADFNTAHPARDKASDGWIGDARHQAETSGHNPDDTAGSKSEYSDADGKAEVRAVDVDDDLRTAGASMQAVIDRMLRTPSDLRRLRYIIYNRRIWSRNTSWQPRAYTGASDHTEHAHFSGDPDFDEDASPWTSVLNFADGGDMGFNADQKADAAFNLKPTVALDTDDSDDGRGSLREFDSPLYAAFAKLEQRVAELEQRPAGGAAPDVDAAAELAVQKLVKRLES